jgi:hypothetical protein
LEISNQICPYPFILDALAPRRPTCTVSCQIPNGDDTRAKAEKSPILRVRDAG